jgi:FkbM family methyltransferase
MVPDLIYDIGAHAGDDTAFYLAKGFRVVAIEANPEMAVRIRSRFRDAINDGRLMLIEGAISSAPGTTLFYVHNESSDWSTAQKSERFAVGNHREIIAKNVLIQDVIRLHGAPYYMKVDIEGGEIDVFKHFPDFESCPAYVSFEDHSQTEAILPILTECGYSTFKVVEQGAKPGQEETPNPPLEGQYVPFKFDGYMSGAFGLELPGDWIDETALHTEIAIIREAQLRGEWGRWYDIHCRRIGIETKSRIQHAGF